jgi:hypothetical protein
MKVWLGNLFHAVFHYACMAAFGRTRPFMAAQQVAKSEIQRWPRQAGTDP